MEKNLLKQSGIIAVIITFLALAFWFGFSKLSLGAYNEKNLTYQFLKEDSEVFKTLVIEVGTDTVARIIAGTSSMTRTGTATYPGQPRIEYSGVTGKWSFKNSGGTETVAFGTVSAAYVAAEIGSTTAKYVLQNDGSSTGQLATNPTLAGQGTITASFGANGLVISPAEYASVNNATGELQAQITTVTGSITTHAHTGSDGTTQIAHNDVTGTGANSHAILDNFIASKAAASGVASLDANSLVAQNLASGTSTPGASKTVMSDGTGKILDGWLSDNVTKLGTPSTSNIPEGSNLYYMNSRVNEAVGSLSVNSHSDVNVNLSNENDFLKIVGGMVVSGSSTATVAFPEVTGVPTDNANFKTEAGTSTVPVRDSDGNLFASGIVGGTTTGALRIPSGTTAQRPASPELGMIRTTYAETYTEASGGSITTSGTYTIHTFTASGNFTTAGTKTSYNAEFYDGASWTVFGTGTPTFSGGTLTCEILVVAGGGGSQANGGGGGAGGGTYTTVSVTNTTTVTVGAGGSINANGNDSSFGSITATGGGKGGTYGGNGSNGGSGGGAGESDTSQSSGGTGIAGQGNDGGIDYTGVKYGAGGGGGAGAVGANATTDASGNGGIGKQWNISGTMTWYCGGGGGAPNTSGSTAGSGGIGGGGDGGTTGVAGTNNTGGGAGGGQNTGNTAGSGIVIIRYPTP